MTTAPLTQPRTAPRIGASWWYLVVLAYGLIVGAGALTRAATFERYLPVIDHYDESLRFVHAYQLRDDAPLGDAYGEITWAEGFPPVQPWVGITVQRIVESRVMFPTPADYIYAMRLLSAVGGVLTTGLLLGFGWLAARSLGPVGAALTGGLVGLVWAIAPQIVATGNFALMDPLIFPVVAAALLCTALAIVYDWWPAAFGALLLVILSIYMKYLLIYALWPVACAVAVLVWRRGLLAEGANRPLAVIGHGLKNTWPWILAMAVVSAITAGWLLFGWEALSLSNTEATEFRRAGLANMLSLSRNVDNFLFTLEETTGMWLWLVTVGLGALGYVYSRSRGWPTYDLRWLWVFVPFAIGCLLLTSSVDVLRDKAEKWYRVRYTLPIAQAFIVMWAASLVQIGGTLYRALNTRRLLISGGVVGALVLVFAIPAVSSNAVEASEYAETHPYEVLWTWSDVSVPQGGILMPSGSWVNKTWNRPWSGYNGSTTFTWGFDDGYKLSAEEYTDEGFIYLAHTDDDFAENEALQLFVDDLLLLKALNRGTDRWTFFYRMLPPENASDVVFGEQIALEGYDLSAETVVAGETVVLRPYWRAEVLPSDNYSMFVHLLPENSDQPLTQFDGTPAAPLRLTLTWDDPNEVLIGTEATLTVPEGTPPGDYRLALGLYNFETGARLPVAEGVDRVMVPVVVE